MKKILAVISVMIAFKSYAQYPRVDIPGSEVRKITSSIVSGQEYELQILLPGGYKNSNKKHQELCLLWRIAITSLYSSVVLTFLKVNASGACKSAISALMSALRGQLYPWLRNCNKTG